MFFIWIYWNYILIGIFEIIFGHLYFNILNLPRTVPLLKNCRCITCSKNALLVWHSHIFFYSFYGFIFSLSSFQISHRKRHNLVKEHHRRHVEVKNKILKMQLVQNHFIHNLYAIFFANYWRFLQWRNKVTKSAHNIIWGAAYPTASILWSGGYFEIASKCICAKLNFLVAM